MDSMCPAGGQPINANIKRIVGFALKGRLPFDVRQQTICRCRWAHVLRGGFLQTAHRRVAGYSWTES